MKEINIKEFENKSIVLRAFPESMIPELDIYEEDVKLFILSMVRIYGGYDACLDVMVQYRKAELVHEKFLKPESDEYEGLLLYDDAVWLFADFTDTLVTHIYFYLRTDVKVNCK